MTRFATRYVIQKIIKFVSNMRDKKMKQFK